MSELSPGAQAVWTAAWEECPIQCGDIVATRRRQITAALRAAADQVVPPTAELEFYDRNPSPVLAKAIEIRTGLLVIAAELEAQP